MLAAPLSVIAGWSPGAHAIGLGKPVVTSHLGVPLDVRIPLVLDAGERADDVLVWLVSAVDRARSGNDPETAGIRMKLTVVAAGRNAPSSR